MATQAVKLFFDAVFLVEEPPSRAPLHFARNRAVLEVANHCGKHFIISRIDIVKNGQIPVDDKGNIVGASTHGISVEQYVEEHCTEDFQEDYRKNGINIPLYDVKYHLHLWVWTTTANYVNDFNVEYTLNDESVATEAGTVQMVIDWLADKNGSVNAENGKAIGTGSYITRLYSKSIAVHRCDFKEQVKGDKTVKKEESTKIFGFKRPNNK